jgi:hypothetical protein
MLKSMLAACAVAAAVSSVPAVQAQVYDAPQDTIYVMPRFAIQGNWGDATDVGIGLRYEGGMTWLFPRAGTLRFVSSFDYFFPEGPLNYWEVNGNLINIFAIPNVQAAGYFGGGLNIANATNGASNTRVGANLLAGIRLPGAFRPFLEGRLELGGGEQFVLTAGLMLR